MADTSGQAEIRGININKNVKAYMDEALIFKNLVSVVSTSAREIRWYQKTSGYIDVGSGTTKIGYGAMPYVAETSWTRTTSYVKKYMLETPMITMEDETDSDVKVFLDNFKDVANKIAYDIDADIWDVVSESQSPTNINDVTATAAWDAGSGQDPFEDIMEAKQLIREQTKEKLTTGYLLVSAKGEKDLLVWLRSVGSTIPMVANTSVESGELLSIAGLKVIVAENVTADYAMVADLAKAAEWQEFMGVRSFIVDEAGIGKKGRVSAHGVPLLVKPKFVSLISNTEE